MKLFAIALIIFPTVTVAQANLLGDVVQLAFQAISSPASCYTFGSFNDTRIGYFDKSAATYCSADCYRNYACCYPMKPNDLLTFKLWKGGAYVSDIIWNDDNVSAMAGCTTINYATHGAIETYDTS